MQQEKRPIFLTETECDYLSARFEPLTQKDIQSGVLRDFVVYQKEDVLKQLVRYVLARELAPLEQQIAVHSFMQGETNLELARNLCLSRSRVQTLKQNTKAKLEAYLKYPFLLDFNLLHPQSLFFDVLKEYGGKK